MKMLFFWIFFCFTSDVELNTFKFTIGNTSSLISRLEALKENLVNLNERMNSNLKSLQDGLIKFKFIDENKLYEVSKKKNFNIPVEKIWQIICKNSNQFDEMFEDVKMNMLEIRYEALEIESNFNNFEMIKIIIGDMIRLKGYNEQGYGDIGYHKEGDRILKNTPVKNDLKYTSRPPETEKEAYDLLLTYISCMKFDVKLNDKSSSYTIISYINIISDCIWFLLNQYKLFIGYVEQYTIRVSLVLNVLKKDENDTNICTFDDIKLMLKYSYINKNIININKKTLENAYFIMVYLMSFGIINESFFKILLFSYNEIRLGEIEEIVDLTSYINDLFTVTENYN